ncbi:MAG: HAD family hydrolase [Chloroflexota bacterium]
MSRSTKRIDTVLFDLDDTIIDWSTMEGTYGSINQKLAGNVYDHLQEEGHALPERDVFLRAYRDVIVENWRVAKETWAGVNFAKSLQKVFTAVNLDLAQIDLNAALIAYDWGPMPGVLPYEDATDMLDWLKANDYQIGLVTNAMLPMWMRDAELEAYGLLHYFDARITSGDTGYMKPHPAIYWRIMGMLHTTPERCVFVGDRPGNDIVGANDVGMHSVLIDPPHLDHDLEGTVPDFTINTLRELIPILETLD